MNIVIGIGAAALAGVIATGAAAQGVASFYKGRNIDMIVGAGVGGGYDIYGRLVARHLGRHVPGAPKIIVKNVAGGGGIRASNLLFNVSPKDGGTIGTVSRAMITAPLMGQSAAKFDPAKFTWIGSVNNEDNICVAWRTAKVKTWNDLLQTPLIVGSAGQGTSTYTFPVMLRNMFGAKFELIAGYPDGGAAMLAMERGEVESVCISLSSVQTRAPQWLKDGSINVLTLIGLKRNADVPNAPAISEFARNDEQRQLLKIILGPQFAGRPILAPPALPADRTAALRAAFNAMMKDAALLADAKKLRLDVGPATGEEVAALVGDIYGAPKELVAKVQAVSVRPRDMKVTEKKIEAVTVDAVLRTVEKKGAALAIDVKGKAASVTVSGARTKVSVGGAAAKRDALKPGMACAITYLGNGTEASVISCR